MSGVKGKSGRKKNPRGAMRYFTELYDEHAFELAEQTINKALAGDKELLIYCHDRRLGKPRQQTDLNVEGGEAIGAGIVQALYRAMTERRYELMEAERLLQLEEGVTDATEQETQ